MGTLVVPIPPLTEARLSLILPLAVSVVLLGVPFFLSGVVVTIALTRLGAPIGRLYAWDLAGAAAGCLLVIPLLVGTNLTSAMFTAAAATALAAWCFARVAGRRHAGALVLAASCWAWRVWNARSNAFPVLYPKNQGLWLTADNAAATRLDDTRVCGPGSHPRAPVYFWGPGARCEGLHGDYAVADTGRRGRDAGDQVGRRVAESLDWVPHDVTSLPYQVRRGDVAVIGVGGGRDILTAIWGHSRSITGIEINRRLGGACSKAGPAILPASGVGPEVTLVNDEARAHLARTDTQRFDIAPDVAH